MEKETKKIMNILARNGMGENFFVRREEKDDIYIGATIYIDGQLMEILDMKEVGEPFSTEV